MARRVYVNVMRFNRKALPTTETELMAMANAAMMGFRMLKNLKTADEGSFYVVRISATHSNLWGQYPLVEGFLEEEQRRYLYRDRPGYVI